MPVGFHVHTRNYNLTANEFYISTDGYVQLVVDRKKRIRLMVFEDDLDMRHHGEMLHGELLDEELLQLTSAYVNKACGSGYFKWDI